MKFQKNSHPGQDLFVVSQVWRDAQNKAYRQLYDKHWEEYFDPKTTLARRREIQAIYLETGIAHLQKILKSVRR
jgi:hypothetical protein